MPLSKKGKKILANMKLTYSGKEAERIFRAMIAEKKITGAETKTKRPKKRVK